MCQLEWGRCLVGAVVCSAVAASLGGCGSLTGLDGSSTYACQAPEGVRCQSVSGTYYNSLKNNLPAQRARHAASQSIPASQDTRTPTFFEASRSEARSLVASGSEARASALTTSPAALAGTAQSAHVEAGELPMPLRSSGKVLGLWFKAWQDADGDLFDQGHVYVQIDRGDWLIDHVQRLTRDAYAPARPPSRAAGSSPGPGAGTGQGAMPSSSPASGLVPGESIRNAVRAQQSGQIRTDVQDDE